MEVGVNMMLESEAAREKIQIMAAHLDKVTPGWYNRIDIDRLQMMNCTKCIIGQVYKTKPEMYTLKACELLRDAKLLGSGYVFTTYAPIWAQEILARRANDESQKKLETEFKQMESELAKEEVNVRA